MAAVVSETGSTGVGRRAIEVLVVDPDMSTVSELRSALAGAVVHHAPDAYRALHELESGAVDVIVTELHLPGANGVELLERLCARESRVPVVVLSHARGAASQLCELGVAAVLTKPASSAALAAAVRHASRR